ncbi:MAG: response regulator transcription factor [Candidatus Omnitrophota bacterium]
MKNVKKILLIDDEKDFLSLLKDALEIRDFEVIAVDNAVEAGMELASKLPELILMDIKMPGIDGLQACAAIRRNPATKNIPIIVVSALSDESYRKEARKLGVAEYFVKPVDIEKLIRKIKEIL